MTLANEARPAGGRGSVEFDRTPPQSIEAEQSVLGAMMLSKDAIADVVEIVRPGDFYRPAHQLIYDSILDLYGRGEPADAVTVSAELTRQRAAGARRRRAVPAHADLARPDRGQRRLLRADRRRAGDAAPAGRRRHAHRADGLRDGVGLDRHHRHRRRRRRPRAGRGLRGHRAAHVRGLRAHRDAAAAHARRDRQDQLDRRHRHRHPDRIPAARRVHQRPAPGADDHGGRPAR